MECDLTYSFSGLEGQLVAVLSGEVDFPQCVIAYLAAAYLQTQQGLHIELTICQKDETGKINTHHKCCIALYCPIGDIEQLAPIAAEQSPWQGCYDQVIAPEHYQNYSLAQQALAYAVTVIKTDAYLWEYVQTGRIKKLEHTDLILAYYHVPQNPWPFEYVILGLQICSLSLEKLKQYVPDDSFPPIVFEIDGAVQSNNLVSVIL